MIGRWLWPLLLCASAEAATLAQQVGAMVPGTWAPITTENTAASVDPKLSPATNARYAACLALPKPCKSPPNPYYNGMEGWSAVWSDWNSGAWVPDYGPCGSLVYGGGGHNGYWGNGNVALNLCGGPGGGLQWELLNAPYDAPMAWTRPPTEAYPRGFPDGTPPPSHNYDTWEYIPTLRSVIVMGHLSSNAPMYGSMAWLFSMDTKRWSGPYPHRGARYGITAWDTEQRVLWFQPAQQFPGEFSRLDPATMTFSYFGKPAAGMARADRSRIANTDAMGGYDPVGKKVVATSFRIAGRVSMAERDTHNPAAPWVVVPMLDRPAKVLGQHTMSWSAPRAAWIVWMDRMNDGRVWQVKREPAGYRWTLLTDASNTVIPTLENHSGAYEKFRLIAVDGVEILIGMLRLDDGVFAFRLPPAR